MKFPGEASERIARTLLARGPSTTAEIAQALVMTSAGIRRPLHALVEAGLVSSHERAPYGPSPKRRRGRPSSVYALTARGRAACDQAYDDLAIDVLRFLDSSYGPDAVQEFAETRARRLTETLDATAASKDPAELARALSDAGYAAQVEPLAGVAVQLCQHHCPVVDAAREFPALCEAETAELGRVLGRHVTRLATLAHGDEVCTTVIPISAGDPQPVTTGRRASA